MRKGNAKKCARFSFDLPYSVSFANSSSVCSFDCQKRVKQKIVFYFDMKIVKCKHLKWIIS